VNLTALNRDNAWRVNLALQQTVGFGNTSSGPETSSNCTPGTARIAIS